MKFFHGAVILSLLILSGSWITAHAAPSTATWADLPENDKSSAYLPENSRTSNATLGQSRAALEHAGVRGVDNESGSEALQGSFRLTVPLVSYRGRSEGSVLGMHYNARLWIRAGGELYSNLDADLRGAPGWNLGQPKIIGGILIEPDGTRHPAKRTVTVGNTTEEVEATYVTTDGSQIQYTIRMGPSYPPEVSGEARYPDGSVVVFEGAWSPYNAPLTSITHLLPRTVFNTELFAKDIVDRNGNVTSIEYNPRNAYPTPLITTYPTAADALRAFVTITNIKTITDPMGRKIHFHYDKDYGILTAITGPGRGNSTRVLARLTYRVIQKYVRVDASDPTKDSIQNTSVLEGIFFPEDRSGYWFGDPDSYSQYGMLKKVIKQNEMTHTATSLNDLGQLQQGTFVLARTYDFPDAPPPTGERRAFPRFKTLTETWAGMDTPPAVTTYTIIESSELESVRTQLPDGSIRRTLSDVQTGLPAIREREGVQNHSYGQTRFVWETGTDGRKRIASVEEIDSQEAQPLVSNMERKTVW